MEDEQYDAMFADLLDGFAAETDVGFCYESPRDSSETMSPDIASAGSLEDDEWIKPAQSIHGDMLFGDQHMMVHGGTWPSPLSPEHTMNTVPMHHAPHGTPSLGSVQMPDSANILAQALPSVLSSYAGAHGPQYMMPGPMGDPAHAAIFAAAAAAAATAAAQMQARGAAASQCFPGPVMGALPQHTQFAAQKQKMPIKRLNGRNEAAALPAAEKRSHSKVERRYRDKLQGELSALRDAVPATHSSKRLDKAAVMRKAVDYIKFLEKENEVLKQEREKCVEVITSSGLMDQLQLALAAIPHVATPVPARTQSEEDDVVDSSSGDGDDQPPLKRPRSAESTGPATGTRLAMFLLCALCCFNPLAMLAPSTTVDMPSMEQDMHGQRVLSSYTELHYTVDTQQTLLYLAWWGFRMCVFFLAFARLLAAEPVVSPDTREWAEAMNYRKMAKLAMSHGRYATSQGYAETALGRLGHPMPQSLLSLIAATMWQIVRQLSHRVGFGLVLDVLFANRAERARDTYAATAGLLHTISCGMMLSGIVDMRDWLRAFYAVICALNLGEAVGEAASSSAVARVHVQFAMTVKACPLLPPRMANFIVRWYMATAAFNWSKREDGCEGSGFEWMFHRDGMEFFLESDWVGVFADRSRVLGAGEPLPAAALGHLYRAGMLRDALEGLYGTQSLTYASDSLSHVAEEAGDANDFSIARCAVVGMAVCSLRANNAAEVRRYVGELQEMGAESRSYAERAIISGLMASLCVLERKFELAMQVVDHGSEELVIGSGILDAASCTFEHALLCIASDLLLSVRLSLWQALMERTPSVPIPEGASWTAQAMREAIQRDMDTLHIISELTPLAVPLLQRFQAKYRTLSNGASVQLRHMLGRAARCAQRQHMVREEGMALVDLCGAMLGDGAAKADVQTHLQKACKLLEQSHSRRDIVACRQLLSSWPAHVKAA